jgi:hypothetical protein
LSFSFFLFIFFFLSFTSLFSLLFFLLISGVFLVSSLLLSLMKCMQSYNIKTKRKFNLLFPYEGSVLAISAGHLGGCAIVLTAENARELYCWGEYSNQPTPPNQPTTQPTNQPNHHPTTQPTSQPTRSHHTTNR